MDSNLNLVQAKEDLEALTKQQHEDSRHLNDLIGKLKSHTNKYEYLQKKLNELNREMEMQDAKFCDTLMREINANWRVLKIKNGLKRLKAKHKKFEDTFKPEDININPFTTPAKCEKNVELELRGNIKTYNEKIRIYLEKNAVHYDILYLE